MEKITVVKAYERTYIIAKDDEYYVAISDKYIDEDGYITCELNGLQMHADKEIATCIRNSVFEACYEHYVSKGFDNSTALRRAVFEVFNVK